MLADLSDNPGTTRGTKLCVLQIMFSHFGWIVALDRWPTGVSVVFAKLAALGQRAFPRVVARLRTDSSHERTLVPPRVCALRRLQSTLLQGFWTFLLSIILSLILFLLIMCIDAPESTTNSSSSGLLEVTSVDIPFDFTRNIKRSFCPNSWACKSFSPIPRCHASFSDQGLLMWSFPEYWRAKTSLMRRTLLDNTSRWTLSFPNFDLMPGAFGEFDGVLWSQHSGFT